MRQYAFQPPELEPMQSAQMQWEDMRNELNLLRDQLEHSNAENTAHAAMIDMLRGELELTKANHERDQVLLIALRTKLKSAGLLLIDALREDTAPIENELRPFVYDKPPKLEEINDESAKEVVRGIRDIANKWP